MRRPVREKVNVWITRRTFPNSSCQVSRHRAHRSSRYIPVLEIMYPYYWGLHPHGQFTRIGWDAHGWLGATGSWQVPVVHRFSFLSPEVAPYNNFDWVKNNNSSNNKNNAITAKNGMELMTMVTHLPATTTTTRTRRIFGTANWKKQAQPPHPIVEWFAKVLLDRIV